MIAMQYGIHSIGCRPAAKASWDNLHLRSDVNGAGGSNDIGILSQEASMGCEGQPPHESRNEAIHPSKYMDFFLQSFWFRGIP